MNTKKFRIVSRIKEIPVLVREAEYAGKDMDAQREINSLVEQLAKGNENPGIGAQPLFNGVKELRGRKRAQVYVQKIDNDTYELLGKSVKSNQGKVIGILEKHYG